MDVTRLTPGLVPMNQTSGEFDYAAFLQDPELNFAADDTYSSATHSDAGSGQKMSPIPKPASRAGTGGDVGPGTPQQKQRLERRGHTKSRRGCFNCKRRRIKCQETHPSCGHCVKSGLKCEYPSLPQITHQPHHQIPLFSLQDMRFFQHFLLQCYPHHPLGNENIWTHEIPCLSHTHEYLMHAILGMAACDLSIEDAAMMPFAMSHRMKAIKAIKKSLTEMPKRNTTHEEANAMIAACFALTFQSVTFDDGMAEYMAFIRGIMIVGMQMWIKGIRPIFTNIMGNEATNVLEPLMIGVPLIQKEWTDAAVTSIANLRTLCRSQVESEYQELLLEMSQMLYSSSWEAYKLLQKQYGWWIMLPHDKFQQLIDRSNQTMILLASHWIALKQIMTFITEHELEMRSKAPPPRHWTDQGMIRWLRHLNKQVDYQHMAYNQWPMWVMEQLDRDLTFFGRPLMR